MRYFPYVPFYSDKFVVGNSSFLEKVLGVWKEYESGDVTKKQAVFADTVLLIFPDTIFRGEKTAALKFFKKRRETFSDVQCLVDSWIPVHAENTGDDLVFVWGMQDCTRKGKREYFVSHEIWRFNKDGKIRELDEYITHPH